MEEQEKAGETLQAGAVLNALEDTFAGLSAIAEDEDKDGTAVAPTFPSNFQRLIGCGG